MTRTRGPKGPPSVCPNCGGRSWYDPGPQVMRCLGKVEGWQPHELGRRPVYGQPCGFQAAAPAGCCGDGVNRHGGQPGGGLEA